VLQQGTLDFKRADPVTGTLGHVIVTPYKPEIPIIIAVDFITGIISIVHERFLVLFRVVEVFNEQTGRTGFAADSKPALLMDAPRFPFIIVHRNFPSRRWFSHRAGPGFDS
jgi:hypothetical protein